MSKSVRSLAIMEDGPVYNPAIGEYEIWWQGELIGYASNRIAAYSLFRDSLDRRREHYERTGELDQWGGIPMFGEPVSPDGYIGPDDIGLVAGVDY